MSIVFRQLGPSESMIYRDVRLECLRDFPAAFCSKYEDARKQKKTGFQLDIEAANQDKFVIGAFDEVQLVGIVAFEKDEIGGHIYQMYVKPNYTRRGIGEGLLKQLMLSAHQSCQVSVFELEVKIDNVSAIRLYENVGFVRKGIVDGEFKMSYVLAP